MPSNTAYKGDNCAFLTAGRDSMVNMWSNIGDCVGSQTAHRGAISFLSEINLNSGYRPNTSNQYTPLMLSLGSDSSIKVWDIKRFRAISEVSVQNSGNLSKAVWLGQSFIVGTTSGSLKLYEAVQQPYEQSTIIDSHFEAAAQIPPSTAATSAREKYTVEWAAKDLPSHSQACTDLICSNSFLASSSKSGQILRWDL